MLRILKKIAVRVDEEEIMRLLSHSKRKAETDKTRLSNLIEQTRALWGKLLHPRGMFRIVDRNVLQDEPYFMGQDRIALGLCTIGDELESKVSQLNRRGRLAQAVVLDAVGSVAAESAADFLNLQICEWCQKRGWGTSQRFSPGYGSWPLEGQKFVFSLLPAQRIKVRLNQSCMMIPRKSVSFAIKIGKELGGLRKKRICEMCNLKGCPYRR